MDIIRFLILLKFKNANFKVMKLFILYVTLVLDRTIQYVKIIR